MTFTSLIEIVDSTLKDLKDPLKPIKIAAFNDLQNEETRRSFAELLTNQSLFKFREPELISFYNECFKGQADSGVVMDRQARPRGKAIHSLIKAAAILTIPAAGVTVMNTSSGLWFEGDHTHSELRRVTPEFPFLPLVGIRDLQRYEILQGLVTRLYGSSEEATLAFRSTYAEVDRALLSMWAYIFTTWMEQNPGHKESLVKERTSVTTTKDDGAIFFTPPQRQFEGVYIRRDASISP
ncbi:hypothetical protein CPB86DRAFT_786873 [Serendipita vermifera]|nr:hypothetical protein CPB86DRAFT_786873 [Serendipita vermifera]